MCIAKHNASKMGESIEIHLGLKDCIGRGRPRGSKEPTRPFPSAYTRWQMADASNRRILTRELSYGFRLLTFEDPNENDR